MGQAIDEGPTLVVGTDTVIKTEHASSEAPQSDESPPRLRSICRASWMRSRWIPIMKIRATRLN